MKINAAGKLAKHPCVSMLNRYGLWIISYQIFQSCHCDYLPAAFIQRLVETQTDGTGRVWNLFCIERKAA
jgi:hypothetical protein